MKRILLTASCVVLCLSAWCQSLSVNEIVNLLNKTGNTAYLKSRSFKPVGFSTGDQGDFKTYIKNGHAGDEEKIYFSVSSISYLTKNKTYINNLLKQVQNRFHLIIKDDDYPDYTFYQFSSQTIDISLNIAKSANTDNNLTVKQKQ